ncbi:MAG: transglutaminase domain-containing protein, partial [Micromonosporaceae bacterium]|nr:transglutaminase domain-containing protein [Micromonosporaceae bacterium]
VLALGTNEPAAKLLDGVIFGVGTLVWTSARLRRLRPPTRSTSRPLRRATLAAGVLAGAGAVAVVITPLLPGAQAPRTVLRDYVVPPFNLSDYPSPLVGFRKYTEDANRLWDQVLFTVDGLPEGATLRIATLDDYDGSVWRATDEDAFRPGTRVGEPAGPLTTIQVTIGAGYAAASDVNAWLPEAGRVSKVDFTGPRAAELGASLYYNRELSAGIVTVRLREGDSFTLTTTLVNPEMPVDAQPYARPDLTEPASAILSAKVAEWTAGAIDLPSRLDAVAEWLRTHGAYTDGGEGEEQFLPGHSIGRLTAFVQDRQPAGNDEQYAAAYALIANYLGIPARVVLGARPDATGAVRGQNVHAWVEVRVADGSWVPIPETEFMPDRSKRPDERPPETFEERQAAVVPPPNAAQPPRTRTDTSREEPPSVPEPPDPPLWERIWRWLRPVLIWAGPPLALLGLAVGAVLGTKARRRHRRRTTRLPANRYAGAWQELVDRVRDLGEVRRPLREPTVVHAVTRRAHAAVLDDAKLLPPGTFTELAVVVDGVIYGDAETSAQDAAKFWDRVERIRKELTKGLGVVARLRVALSLRSLRADDQVVALRRRAQALIEQQRAAVRMAGRSRGRRSRSGRPDSRPRPAVAGRGAS